MVCETELTIGATYIRLIPCLGIISQIAEVVNSRGEKTYRHGEKLYLRKVPFLILGRWEQNAGRRGIAAPPVDMLVNCLGWRGAPPVPSR